MLTQYENYFSSSIIVVKDTGWRNSIPVRLSTERTPCYMLFVALRNKFILVVTYGKVPCFYFLEKALSLH